MTAIKTLPTKYQIVPLSKDRMDDAIRLIKAVFPYQQDQKKAKWNFIDSLGHCTTDKEYWVAVTAEGDIIGITALYKDRKDNDEVWLGWFGVHPNHRRHGLGSRLLRFAISKAEERGYSRLKLYSSFDENERGAHNLYRKNAFIEIKSDEENDVIIFQKILR
jgi:GNAT superfamily N-acetyltransferase